MKLWSHRSCVNAGALATASSALSMVTDIIILALPFKYLIGMSRSRCSIGIIEADLFLSTEDLPEGKDPSHSLDEFGWAVSFDLSAR